MRTWLIVIVVATLWSCSKKESSPEPAAQPPPEPKSAPKPVPAPPDAAAAVAPTACPIVMITVSKDGIAVKRETETKTTQNQLYDTLRDLGQKCIGPAAVIPTADISYESVVAAIDVATRVGFIDVVIASSEAEAKMPAPAKSDALAPKIAGKWEGDTLTANIADDRKDALKKAPVIIARVDGIEIAGKIIKLDVPDLKAQVSAALTAAPKDGPEGLAILQADVASKGSVIIAIIDGAKQAGYGNVLLAVKNK